MIVNNNKIDFILGITINDLIKNMGLPKDIVVVKVNGQKVSKNDYIKQLNYDDNIEIFSMLSGG